MSKHLDKNETKIEDILKAIRNVIDNGNVTSSASGDPAVTGGQHHTSEAIEDVEDDVVQDDDITKQEKEADVLELTSIISETKNSSKKQITDEPKESLVSEATKARTQYQINRLTNALEGSKASYQEQQLENLLIEFIRPLIQNWLNQNLTTMVEKIVSDEIRKIIPNHLNK